MKGSPCCAGLMRSCLHTYRTKTNLTQHIIQPWGGGVISQVWGGHQPSMGGSSTNYGGGPSTDYGGGHQPSMGGPSAKYGGSSTNYGGGHQPTMGGGGIFPPVCTGSQNPQNYFSNTYVLPSVNRTAGPMRFFKRERIYQMTFYEKYTRIIIFSKMVKNLTCIDRLADFEGLKFIVYEKQMFNWKCTFTGT